MIQIVLFAKLSLPKPRLTHFCIHCLLSFYPLVSYSCLSNPSTSSYLYYIFYLQNLIYPQINPPPPAPALLTLSLLLFKKKKMHFFICFSWHYYFFFCLLLIVLSLHEFPCMYRLSFIIITKWHRIFGLVWVAVTDLIANNYC